ncbi:MULTISPECIES: TIR domain-containing protein [Lysinibacillus]|uniref:TIR domain-containing protein n=1 Tax=Lysinibacillus xylanilyticus TaxID=582475 RepID=A0ABV3W501_9BACI
MKSKTEIESKIINNERKSTSYIHPIVSNEYIAKLIAAYSNGDGGDIVFGIRDDGKNLEVKTFSFSIDMAEIKKSIEGSIYIQNDSFEMGKSNIFYISVSKSKDLIKVNNIPYIITSNGILEEMKLKKVFISYAHKDRDLADYLEKSLGVQNNLEITRDINVTSYKDSLSEFMQTIRKHDIVIAIVTSAYIKSLNCMYEITQLMQDVDYLKKLYFIIVNDEDAFFYKEENRYENYQANIYSTQNRIAYLSYWSVEQTKLEQEIRNANLRPALLGNLAQEMKKLDSVLPSVDDFLALLNDRVGRGFKDMYEKEFKDILDNL